MFLRFCLLLAMLPGGASGQTGVAVPALAPFEQLVTRLMSTYRIPGGSIAVTRNGRLVFARGYGYADRDTGERVMPDSRFRIASMSKFVTAVAIMRLVEEGKLHVDDPAFALLPDLQPAAGQTEDPRLTSVTIRHLLTHSGGWDDTAVFDPLFSGTMIASALGVPSPASTENIIRYMRGRPLQFDPGTRFAYCNFGFAVLGRIIEQVAGMSYEQYVRTSVLAPMGIREMRIGQTLAAGRRPGEVRYYADGATYSVLPFVSGMISWPYGGWQHETTDAAGGWVASAIDYAKFVNGIDGRRGERFLKRESIAAMTARPSIPQWATSGFWYAFGVEVHPSRGDADWDHSGSVDGTTTQFFRTSDGLVLVVCFNYRPSRAAEERALGVDLSIGLIDAASRVVDWPRNDLFIDYPDTDPAAAASLPAVTTREGAVNAATFNRGIVAGSWLTLSGANLAPATRSWTASEIVDGALPISLEDVGITIAGKPAYLSYVSPTQINAQAPEGLTPGWSPVEIVRGGVSSGPVLALVVPNAPGAFTYMAGGQTFAIAARPDGKLLGDRGAAPGETIVIYATGLTASPAGRIIPEPKDVSGVELTIGGRSAPVMSATLISPGLFQINAIVPDVEVGNQPLVVCTNGAVSPPGVLLPIHH
jgi:N-acyl-D-amino-acid deacylase